MGFWNEVRSISDKLLNRNDPKACRGPDAVGVNEAVQKLEGYLPCPDHKDKFGQILTQLGRFAVDSAVSDSLKGFTVVGGMQVYKTEKEGSKDQYANDSNNPDLTLTMEQIHAHLEIVQKEMKSTKKEQHNLSNRHKAEAQLEKMHEEMNNTKQEIVNLTRCTKASDPLKELSTQPTKGSLRSKNDVKRVMIRSRL